MIHHSCDRCKRAIDPEADLRYVVRLEVQAVMDVFNDGSDEEEDRDHLLEIDEILERGEDAASELIGDDVYQKKRYDLCSSCYAKFIENPVGRETVQQLNFSSN